MRTAILEAIGNRSASHFGLAYDVLAPPPAGPGKADVVAREQWLDRCVQIPVNADYAHFFRRWRDSFAGVPAQHEVTARSRLLIGAGNPSGADVGLTVHRTWGVPVLPGSALKGLLANYIDAVHASDDTAEPQRRDWRAPVWKNRMPDAVSGIGKEYATLFGASDGLDEHASARAGAVVFHDALYVPGSARPLRPADPDKPFARDVLTVHQKSYYDNDGSVWPVDWDSPNPVAFVTVRPTARFLLALTGAPDWTKLVMELLLAALSEWGAGAKTSAGYGRLGRA